MLIEPLGILKIIFKRFQHIKICRQPIKWIICFSLVLCIFGLSVLGKLTAMGLHFALGCPINFRWKNMTHKSAV